MKKILLLSSMLFMIIFSSLAQPTINKSDMPVVGDTIRVNNSLSVNGDNYDTTGVNYTWNLSNLTSSSQSVDTFKNVLSTSIIYYVYFTGLANLAENAPNMVSINTPLLPVTITNVYDFFDNSTASFSQLGFGAKFNGTPLPVKYSNPDVQLVFPLTYGEKDSCDFSYNVNIPSFGYYGEKEHRVNCVDGWGTIINPIDTFQAMRVRSVVTAHDTIHVDTLINYGTSFNYTTTEYKWYAYKMGVPVMDISVRTGTGASTTIVYPNEPKNTTGIKADDSPCFILGLYPNPVNENTNLYFSLAKPSQLEVNITDLLGRNIKTIASKEYPEGFNSVPLDISGMNLGKGIYFVRVNSVNSSKIIKLEVF
jgi:hypothetical protein